MNRRSFLVRSANVAAALSAARLSGGLQTASNQSDIVRVKIDTKRKLGRIPDNFVGLGYEISSVATPGLLSANNRKYVQLVRTLAKQGVIRVGGNTSDDAAFSPNGKSVAVPKGTVVNADNFRDLGTFLHATGWKLIWGLNLGSGTEQNAVDEALAIASAVEGNLLAFEIGNEPDLFGRGKATHRPKGYSYDNYLAEYRRYKSAIRAKLPNAPFAGPDAADATDWVVRFAADEGSDLKLLTHHYYRECAGPASTLEKLLHPDPKLAPELAKFRAASSSSGVPFRICETNSFCGGGKPGVSDTFGSALWTLDYFFTLAWDGAAGVNLETGINQLGFISSYSPIGDDQHSNYSAQPDYYGMLAFARASYGERIAIDYKAADRNVTAYAVLGDDQQLFVTIINKEVSRSTTVNVSADQQFINATTMRLNAPSLTAKNGVKLGGAEVNAMGEWHPQSLEKTPIKKGEYAVNVAAGSAAIVILSR